MTGPEPQAVVAALPSLTAGALALAVSARSTSGPSLRGGRCGGGGEAGEDGEGEAARGHAPCMPGSGAGYAAAQRRPASSHSRIEV